MRGVAIAITVIAMMGCAAGSRVSRPALDDRNVLTAAEIVAAGAIDTYHAVSRLRPQYLTTRAGIRTQSGGSEMPVYLDGLKFGDVESLHQIPLGGVRQIHYLAAWEADVRWGGQHPRGAIHVITRASGIAR